MAKKPATAAKSVKQVELEDAIANKAHIAAAKAELEAKAKAEAEAEAADAEAEEAAEAADEAEEAIQAELDVAQNVHAQAGGGDDDVGRQLLPRLQAHAVFGERLDLVGDD